VTLVVRRGLEDRTLVPQSGIRPMTSCDLDSSVPDWIIEHPATFIVFQELGIDYGCEGKSLAYACRQQGIDPKVVLAQLRRCIEGAS
jgi:regulator of cell morphogenesis and NO signaling